MNKWINGIIMGNKIQNKFSDFHKSVDNVIFESKKYNLIDRFFHLSIEDTNLNNYVNSLIANDDIKQELICYSFLIHHEIDSVIEKIKSCYGIKSTVFHIKSEKIVFLNDPNLLGISPFLFNQKEWKEIIVEEIRKSKHKADDINHIYNIIENCLNETFERLGVKEFSDLRYKFYNDEWNEDILNATDMFALIVDEFIENSEILEIDENEEKQKDIFLKSEMINKSIELKIQINLSFELADKIFKKYFEINFTKERFSKIYTSFRIFLKIICNKTSMQNQVKSIDLNEEEVKKMIGFFKKFKSTKTSPNIFTYEVRQLIDLMERISGLESKTTWDKAHREDKYKIENSLMREINSIIPEEFHQRTKTN